MWTIKLIVGCLKFRGKSVVYILSKNKFITILKLYRNEGKMGQPCNIWLMLERNGELDRDENVSVL
jgi:hypothetical protein